MFDLNFGSSVVKREAKDVDKVRQHLERSGWELTGSIGSRAYQYESSGVSITVMKGPLGTVIFPSGPIRGSILGKNNVLFSDTSVIGAGSSVKNKEQKAPKDNRRTDTAEFQ